MAAVAAAQSQKAVSEDAALEEGVELVLDELRQVGAGRGFGLGEEGRNVLLHQPVEGGLRWAVALLVDRDAIGRPLGLPANGLHAWLPTDALADALLDDIARRSSLTHKSLSSDGLDRLIARHWPGNILELRRALESPDDRISARVRGVVRTTG